MRSLGPCWVFYVLFVGATAAMAQGGDARDSFSHADFFSLLRPDHADITLGGLYEPEHEEKDGPGSYSLKKFSGSGELLAPLGRDLYLRGGLEYAASLYDFDLVSGARTSIGEETLHRAVLNGGIGMFLSENVLVTGVGSLGIYSDFDEGIDLDHAAIYGSGMLVYRVNPGAQLLLGIERSEVFDETPLFPLLGLRLLSEDGKLHFSLTLPLEARIGWHLSSQSELYVRGRISGERYRIAAGPENTEFSVSVRDQRVGLGAQLWFGEHVGVTLEGGLAVGSELEFKVRDAGQFDGELKEAGYLSCELGFAL